MKETNTNTHLETLQNGDLHLLQESVNMGSKGIEQEAQQREEELWQSDVDAPSACLCICDPVPLSVNPPPPTITTFYHYHQNHGPPL